MGFFDFIEEHDRIGFPTHSLCQLTTFIVAHIAWRCTNQTRHTVLLLILTHVDTRHHRLVVKQVVGQCLGELRLTDTRRTEEDKRGNRSLGVLQAGTRTAYSIADSCDRLLLTNDTLMQFLLQVKQFFAFTLHHTCHRDARPAAHHLCDIIGSHLLAHQ